MKPTVYVVHCIDTEGPLNEDIVATFQRIKNLTGVELFPSKENLYRIQKKEINLNGYEDIAAKVFSKRLMSYNRNWNDIDKMLDRITSAEFRADHADSEGNGWVYSWFLVDLADFVINPRNRDIGYNNIFRHYESYYRQHGMNQDDFQWHAHPMSVYREAHRCATSYINSPHIFESLCHRIIDCNNFPNCFRPGYHIERPDSHWLLEQYIPFDFGNQAIDLTEDDLKQEGPSSGRFGDWRRSPATWEYYNPSHDDYQTPGFCNRTIFRCLNVGTRLRLMTEKEVDKAFERAQQGYDTVLAFCDHDFRDMSYDVEDAYRYIKMSAEKYPDVRWINSKASDAACAVLKLTHKPIELEAFFDPECKNRLIVKTSIDSFGAQPFLAVKTKGGRYINDNFDLQLPNRMWSYTFDADSIHFDDVDKIGIATNSREGSGALVILDSNGIIEATKKW